MPSNGQFLLGSLVNEKLPERVEEKRIAILCVIAIVAILFGTLWPFNPWPVNEAKWLANGNGVRLGHDSVVLSEGPLRVDSAAGNSCSIEMLLRPESFDVPDTILGFYVADRTPLLVRQWIDSLLVTRDLVDGKRRVDKIKFDLDHAFQIGKLDLLTITSGPNGTAVYRNATRAEFLPNFVISPGELSGQIVLGTSPTHYSPWFGEIRGLAVYSKELTAAEVSRHYAEWTAVKPSSAPVEFATVARYRFSEGSGQEIHNDVTTGPNLVIPRSFDVPHKLMLTSLVKEFQPDLRYARDIVTNIVGFIPLGMILCVFFSLRGSRSEAIVRATIAGGVLSLVIEILQAYIPRRGSGTTDIITNSLGALIGAAIARPDWIRMLLRAIGLLPSPMNKPTSA